MRMDRYEENVDNEKDNDSHQLSRQEKNKQMYNNAYDSSKVIDFELFFDKDEEEDNIKDNDDNTNIQNKTMFEEKNYNVEDYLKNAHNNMKQDNNIRNLDNNEFKIQEDKISKLIASIDEQNENDEFFSDLIGEDEDTIIEGQLTKEEFTKTTYEEFYKSTISEIDNTKLEKALSDETMTKLELEDENLNNTFQDIFKSSKMSKKRKKALAITIFSVSLFALIIVVLIILFK